MSPVLARGVSGVFNDMISKKLPLDLQVNKRTSNSTGWMSVQFQILKVFNWTLRGILRKWMVVVTTDACHFDSFFLFIYTLTHVVTFRARLASGYRPNNITPTGRGESFQSRSWSGQAKLAPRAPSFVRSSIPNVSTNAGPDYTYF